MYKSSDFTKQVYRPRDVAAFLGVTTTTVRNYADRGILKATVNDKGQRLFYRDDLIASLNDFGLIYDDADDGRRDVVYARVTSHDQKAHGDLDRQALFLVEHAPDIKKPLILTEVGSGLNDNRKQLQKLLVMVANNEVRNIYVTYKDRLTRFGYKYLETMFSAHGTVIVILKDPGAEAAKTAHDELVEDMMSLLTSFSGKLYGMRSGKHKKEAPQNDKT